MKSKKQNHCYIRSYINTGYISLTSLGIARFCLHIKQNYLPYGNYIWIQLSIISSLLILSNFTFATEPNSVTVYVYPPSSPLDYSSPKTLTRSFGLSAASEALMWKKPVKFISDFHEPGQISSGYRSADGHTISHVQCKTTSGETFERWTSLTGMNDLSVTYKNMVTDSLGFGALSYPYADGEILSGAENLNRLLFYHGPTVRDNYGRQMKAHPMYMRFNLDADGCDQVKKYVEFYESFHFSPGTKYADLEAKDPDTVVHFTSSMDAYDSYMRRIATGRGEVGGGCANYGIGLLKVAGVFDPKYDEYWKRSAQVSDELIGKTVDAHGVPRKVPIWKILWTPLGNQWTRPGISHQDYNGYEPEKIWQYILAHLNTSSPEFHTGPLEVLSGVDPGSRRKITQEIQGIVFEPTEKKPCTVTEGCRLKNVDGNLSAMESPGIVQPDTSEQIHEEVNNNAQSASAN